MLKTFSKKISKQSFFKSISDELNKPLFSGGGLLPVLLVFACLSLNIYVRLFPAYLPGLAENAVLNVINRYSGALSKKHEGNKKEIDRQVPEELQELIGKDPAAFSRDVGLEQAKLKDPYQDEHGLTYLMEYDPYAWAQWTENVVKNGHPGNKIVNGKSYDSTMVAPLGLEVFHFTGLFYLTAFLYKGVCLFTNEVSLQRFLFFIPVFYSACFLLIFFLFVRRGSQSLSAFFAVLLSGCMSESIQRGSAGWYDFDMLSLLLAIAVAWCLLEAVRGSGRRWGTLVLFSVLAAFFEGLYAKMWMGWWFMLIVGTGFFAVAMIAQLFSGVGHERNAGRRILPYAVSALLFLGFSFVFAQIFAGIDIFERIRWLRGFLRFDTAISADIWPNVFYTISELSALSLKGLAARFYGPGPWIFAGVCGSVFCVIYKEWRTERRDLVLMLLCWFLFMLAASFKANRFVIFLAIPSFTFFSIAVFEYIPAFIVKRRTGFKRVALGAVFLCAAGFLMYMTVSKGISSAEEIFPFMNDSWHKALTYVDQHAPKDAILNAWWDQGSWYRYYGKRRAIFDGQSQNGQLCYWMARVLKENDEAKALAILRMLNNNSMQTYYEMLPYIADPFLCKKVLEDLLTAGREKGGKILQKYPVPSGVARQILDSLYGRPAPAYFIVEESLLGKMPSISFLGNWDFRKLLVRQNESQPRQKVLSLLESSLGSKSVEAEKIYNDTSVSFSGFRANESLSTRYSFSVRPMKGKNQGHLMSFDNGVVYDPDSQDVLFYSGNDQRYYTPREVVFFENGRTQRVHNEKGDIRKTVIVVKEGKECQSLIADDELAESLFFKLYFLGGRGLKHFKPFYADEENKIYIYQIEWS